MAKFVIECPSCGSYAEGKTGFFAKKKIQCACGHVIDVRTEKLATKRCEHCGNNVLFDQSKGEKALCPVCKTPINTVESLKNVVEIPCPQCSCILSVDKAAARYECPICDHEIDVQREIERAEQVKSGKISVIKYEGANDTFVWRHPITDFNFGSQLIVHESQEALFFRDGKALDLFPSGRYTLETQQLPLISRIQNLPAEPGSVFHSEVYYINLTTQMGIKWGTDSRVRFVDPITGLPLDIGACGEMNMKVSDSRKLIIKLVGTAGMLSQAELMGMSGAALTGAFRALVLTSVKTHLAKTIKSEQLNILEIEEHLLELSAELKTKINESLADYGLTLPEFYVTRISLPEDDPNFKRMRQQHADQYLKVREEQIRKAEAEAAAGRKMVEAETEARMKIIGAQGEAEAYRLQAEAEAKEMQMKGYTYQQETSRMVGMEAMQNGLGGAGGGGGLGDIAGLGVTLGAMGGVIGMTKDALSPVIQTSSEMGAGIGGTISGAANTWDCACGSKGVVGNFCNNCGAKRPAPVETWDCACGSKGIIGNFCNNCGAKKPAPPETWDCACGSKGIVGNFCSNCGARKPSPPETWDCACGNKDITGSFCSNCGAKKE